jgi:hypothetical protein
MRHELLVVKRVVGTSKAPDRRGSFLSQTLAHLVERFVAARLNENDLLDYARAITNQLGKNESLMPQTEDSPNQQLALSLLELRLRQFERSVARRSGLPQSRSS